MHKSTVDKFRNPYISRSKSECRPTKLPLAQKKHFHMFFFYYTLIPQQKAQSVPQLSRVSRQHFLQMC